MTDIERKARAMLNDARDAHVNPDDYLVGFTALCRAIEQHEAFRQEVSDAVEKQAQTGWDIHCRCGTRHPISFNTLEQFIIRKPDPLVAALKKAGWGMPEINAKELRDALGSVGFEIREKNDG